MMVVIASPSLTTLLALPLPLKPLRIPSPVNSNFL